MKKIILLFAIGLNAFGAEINLAGNKSPEEQGWKQGGEMPVKVVTQGERSFLHFNDDSDTGRAFINIDIPQELSNEIAANGFELKFKAKINPGNASPNGIELIVAKHRFVLNLFNSGKEQSINIYDSNEKKFKTAKVKDGDNVHEYLVKWTPVDGLSLAVDGTVGADKIPVLVFNRKPSLSIGGWQNSAKARIGSMELESLSLKAVKP